MSTQNELELRAFGGFKYKIGDHIRTNYEMVLTGFVVARSLVETEAGICKVYGVRHNFDAMADYSEFEIQLCDVNNVTLDFDPELNFFSDKVVKDNG